MNERGKRDVYVVTIQTHGRGGGMFDVYAAAVSLGDAERVALANLSRPEHCTVAGIKRIGELYE